MTDLRREYAEHLVTQALSGLMDDHWRIHAMAFVKYCYRVDNKGESSVICNHCPHPHHKGDACGTPVEGDFPRFDVCLCGVKNAVPPKRVALDMEVMRTAFDWIDAASNLLRSLQNQTDSTYTHRIVVLLKELKKGGMAMFLRGQR